MNNLLFKFIGLFSRCRANRYVALLRKRHVYVGRNLFVLRVRTSHIHPDHSLHFETRTTPSGPFAHARSHRIPPSSASGAPPRGAKSTLEGRYPGGAEVVFGACPESGDVPPPKKKTQNAAHPHNNIKKCSSSAPTPASRA